MNRISPRKDETFSQRSKGSVLIAQERPDGSIFTRFSDEAKVSSMKDLDLKEF